MKNELWEKEEFEDIIERAFIGMYEDKNLTKKKKFKRHPKTQVKKSDIFMMKSVGCYFPPNDRAIHSTHIDIVNDGLPGYAIYTGYDNFVSSANDLRDYIQFYFARKLKRLPGGFKTKYHHAYYELSSWFPQQKETGSYMTKELFGINQYGQVDYAKHGDMVQFDKNFYKMQNLVLLATLQLWADRKHLWNVMAKEGGMKGTFGVYEEQIKSLFYARDLPVSAAGRKRPILHWVSAHRRRIRMGTDVEVKKHLRGVNKFEMNGTLFEITQPMKISKNA